MTTLTLDRVSEQGAIAKNLGFAQNNLFASTNQAIDFWLETLKKRDNLPKKEYLEYLNSFGWSNRNASPYIKMADFIRSNLMDCREAIARLDIRTLIKLPRIRYASIVEAIKEFAPTQKQVSDLIKKLPPSPKGYKSAEQKQDEVFELNVPAATGAVITEAAELLGLTNHSLILLGAKLVKAIATGDDGFVELMEQIQYKVTNQADEETEQAAIDEQAIAQQEFDTYIDEQVSEMPDDIKAEIAREDRITELTANLRKVNKAITSLVNEGYDDDSLPMVSAREGKEAIVRELAMYNVYPVEQNLQQ